jgi:hypothetical protein
LGVRRYDFKDDDGARVEGSTLHYLTLDSEQTDDQRGEIPMSCSAPPALFHQLGSVPGTYEVDFRQRPGRGGKPTVQAVGVAYLGGPSLGDGEVLTTG